MTSKIIVNNVGADAGIASVHFDSNIQRGTSNLHSTGLNVSDTFLHSTGLNVGTGATIHQPANNVMTLGTNSSERVRITGIGSVGIGTDDPQTTLDVNGIVTATSYRGDGSQLTGIDSSALSFSGATKIQANNSGVIVTGILTTTQYRPGEIIETIACMCDGRTVSVQSGNYTITDVTAAQSGTLTYATATGSEISYTPPAGTKNLVYNYEFQFNVDGQSGLSHFRTSIDGTVVLPSQRAFSANYPASNYHHAQMRFSAGYTFDLNAGSTDLAQGKLATGSWTSGKTIKVECREYNSSYQFTLHKNHYWDGGSSSGSNQEPIKPTLYIQAIA